jgi:hypothetical protein
VPAEGSVLPDSYDFERGEAAQAVLLRMQAAMKTKLAELWAKRAPGLVVKTPQEAVVLASIVEKETGKPAERRHGGGALFQPRGAGHAAPAIIYPITKGKPLGRRIRRQQGRAHRPGRTHRACQGRRAALRTAAQQPSGRSGQPPPRTLMPPPACGFEIVPTAPKGD